jgi:predicted transcriptional regulator
MEQNDLMQFFKVLADAERLKIAGALAAEPLTIEQLAHRLSIKAPTVQHHLEQLSAAGLVRADGLVYRVDSKLLEGRARSVLAQSRPQVSKESFEGDAYDQKVLAGYMTPDGSLKTIPTQHKKLLVILRHLVKLFEPGQQYTEKQVNEILSPVNRDTASLRRYLVDEKFMARQSGVYWRVEQSPS